MKTYVAIVRDHSASMSYLTREAMNDFNLIIQGIKDSKSPDDQTYISVVECGVGPTAINRIQEVNMPVESIKELTTYTASGSGTPLLDAVNEAINVIGNNKLSYHDDQDNVAYLVMVITDGEENRSRLMTSSKLSEIIRTLQASDKWTFVFRGPKGSARTFAGIGVAQGNILEWEQTSHGLTQSTVATSQGITSYFVARSAGRTSSSDFYAANITASPEQVKASVADTTSHFEKWSVLNIDNASRIDEFVKRIHGVYQTGRAFYQLTKTEKAVQDYKELALLDKNTGKIYSGTGNVRSILGLPTYGTVKLVPGNHKNYDIFIQSTSVNRKLVGGTTLLYKKA